MPKYNNGVIIIIITMIITTTINDKEKKKMYKNNNEKCSKKTKENRMARGTENVEKLANNRTAITSAMIITGMIVMMSKKRQE